MQFWPLLKSGRLPFIESARRIFSSRRSRDNSLIFTSTPTRSRRTGPVIVTIGTPVDEFLNPERHVVLDCIDARCLIYVRWAAFSVAIDAISRNDQWIAAHLKRKNRDLKFAFCPEVVQGYGIDELATDAANRQRHHARGRSVKRRSSSDDRAGSP